MDRDGDAALVSTPSFSEQEMDREPPERKIFTRADTADSAGVLALLSILGSIVSGILLSRYVFAFLKWNGAASLARTLHMACAYWGFVWMSLHLGTHWGMVTGMAAKGFQTEIVGGISPGGKWTARAVGAVIAGYGAYAFVKREIGSYLLMRIQFVFFDYEEPVFFFILDYMAVMGLFVFLGHYLSKGLKKAGAVKK